MSSKDTPAWRTAASDTRASLEPKGVHDISVALNLLLADMFTLYMKTKNFHWHVRSIGHIARLQRLLDNDSDDVAPREMLAELRQDNVQLAARLREAHGLCDEHGDVASASLLETWIDEAEGRAWFLSEASRPAEDG